MLYLEYQISEGVGMSSAMLKIEGARVVFSGEETELRQRRSFPSREEVNPVLAKRAKKGSAPKAVDAG